MPPIVALILCLIFVTVLLRIEQGQSREVSGALWLPTVWLLISGSRPIGRWFEFGNMVVEIDETGSPLDRFVLGTLMVLASLVLFKRRIQLPRILQDNLWLVLLYLYLGLSVLWSDFPEISFKRWIRLSGTIPVALIILTEQYPLKALESVFRRCAYVLIPFSLVLIKYFPDMGVGYVTWSGEKMWVGVTSQKNGLGVLCVLSAFLIIWSLHNKWRTGGFLKNSMHTSADVLVLAIAVFLLQGFQGAFSATAIGILIVGVSTFFILSQAKSYAGYMGIVLVLGVSVVLISLQTIDSVRLVITQAFNRDPTFTGRTDIWNLVLEEASKNHWFGGGYGGYWYLADEKIFRTQGVREAHSGYLEIYLAGGITGAVIFTLFLIAYCRKMLRELRYAKEWGMFGLSFLMMILVESFTESIFITTSSYFWSSMVIISIVLSESVGRQSERHNLATTPKLRHLPPAKLPDPVDDSRIHRSAK